MTPDEIKAFLADRLFPKKRATLTRADFITAWQGLDDAVKDTIIGLAIEGNDIGVGKALVKMLNDYALGQAQTRANEIVANGTLDLSEFNEVFD